MEIKEERRKTREIRTSLALQKSDRRKKIELGRKMQRQRIEKERRKKTRKRGRRC